MPTPARRRVPAHLVVLAAAAVVLALSAAGFAVAQGQSGGEVKACASKKTGAVRLLTKGRCAKSERAVSWSRRGPAGPRGATGAAGPAGPAGPAGGAAAPKVTVRTAQLTVTPSSCYPVFSGLALTCSVNGSATAACEPGEQATSGGYGQPAAYSSPAITEDQPTPSEGTPTGWKVAVTGSATTTYSETPPDFVMPVRVVCLAP